MEKLCSSTPIVLFNLSAVVPLAVKTPFSATSSTMSCSFLSVSLLLFPRMATPVVPVT